MAHPQIAVFARLAKGGEGPRRLIFGQNTLLSRTMHDIRYNERRDEIYVANPFAQAILTFRGDAGRDSKPIRIIQGPKTRLIGGDTLEVDAVNDEIIVPLGREVLVFPLLGEGDVAPIRTLKGGDENGWRSGGGVGVDNVHEFIVTDGTRTDDHRIQTRERGYARGRNSILVFNRLDDGDVFPLRIINGPRTGINAIRQMAVQPEGGWVVIAQISNGGIPEPEGTFVGVWSIYDDGDVPPRWRIEGKPGNILKKPRGMALNPNHKELLVSDMRLNAVLTFSFPEIF